MSRVVIDPVTRIGGHLRIEVELTDGVVSDALSSGTVFRGIELVLRDRDPRDAWLLAQRVCGTCTSVHALASVRAVESALGVRIPKNARLVRNLMAGTQFVDDHVVGFYHRQAFDWVDAAAAATADPVATSAIARARSEWSRSSATYFRGVRDRLATYLLESPAVSLAGGYAGHPAYRLSPEESLLLVAHYIEALGWRRRIARIEVFLGGKDPHPQTYLVGGMALAPPWGGPARAQSGEHPRQVERASPVALSTHGLSEIGNLVGEAQTFVEQVYVPDVMALAAAYRDWMAIGAGVGDYLAYGEFPEDDSGQPVLLLPRGRILGRDLSTAKPVDPAAIAETVAHSHYAAEGDGGLVRPADGETVPQYAGPPAPVISLEGSERYSWLKAPRYDGEPMEVGPLARVLVAYAAGRGEVTTRVDAITARLGIRPAALSSSLGRIVATAIEAQVVASQLDGWLHDLRDNLATGDLAVADITSWDPAAWSAEARGSSLGESSRGAVGHWVTIRGRRVDAYQIVDASTWNASPRDARGRRGPIEEALLGTPVVDPDRPVEVLRTIHSFDPCTACAAHLFDPSAGGPIEVRVRGGGVR